MAYSTGAYTDQDNALSLFYAWALTNGWTQNYYGVDGTGYRAHISKTIDGLPCFLNLKSSTAETGSWGSALTGIAVNGSSAWTGSGTVWDEQAGHTTYSYAGSGTLSGNVDELITTGGVYHFFATPTTLSAVFETDSEENDWRMMTMGNVGGTIFYATSGGTRKSVDAVPDYIYDARSSFLSSNYAGGSTSSGQSGAFDGTGWYNGKSSAGSTAYYTVCNMMDCDYSNSNPVAIPYGSVGGAVAVFSPDSFRGNVQLAPSTVTVVKDLANEIWSVGDIEGVKLVNMRNNNNESEVVYGGGTYKMFKVYNPKEMGVAFLK